MSDTFDIAMAAIASGIFSAAIYVWGYHRGRKDRTPGDRK